MTAQGHKNLPFGEYLAIDALSSSGVRRIVPCCKNHPLASPAHYQAYLSDDDEPTKDMRLGTLFHTAFLEPERFAKIKTVGTPPTLKKKQKEDTENIYAIKSEYELAKAAATSALKDITKDEDLSSAYFGKDCYRELSVTWTDERTGVPCKARLDWLSTNRPAILDFKFTLKPDARQFKWSVLDHGYDIQAAYYINAAYQLTGEVLPFIFVTIDRKYPHTVSLYELDSKWIVEAEEKIDMAMDLYAQCRESGEWPALPVQAAQTIAL